MFWLGKRRGNLSALEYLVMLVLVDKSLASNDVISKLNEVFRGVWNASPTTILPVISKMSKKGLLVERDAKSPAGPRVKIYGVSDKGRLLLEGIVDGNQVEEIEFIRRYLDLIGRVITTSEFRDIMFALLDYLKGPQLAQVGEYSDPDARFQLVTRVKELCESFLKGV
ncbi:MAG: PadR family transcriptional regulator [Promethearchaeota archaeon]